MKYKILLVEDDKFLSSMYAHKLSKEDVFEVKLATTGAAGLSLALEWQPDLILLDIFLPEVDGLTILKKIREEKTIQQPAIIMLTNLDEKEQIDTALQYNVDDYLIKAHFLPNEVINKVKAALKKKFASPRISSHSAL
ncbi:MAG: Two component transcriptional regulator, winged helix family [Parcubacteria group bacterium GW2011_GWA2_44_12]|nr:MAG: Two component transcriptional regulator, winged helix family [Parcubacteria group bacterium GW2011_GWA2_44_12]